MPAVLILSAYTFVFRTFRQNSGKDGLVLYKCQHLPEPETRNEILFSTLNCNTMTTQINAYLTFKGNCKEAMTFYQECIGGSLTLMTVGESPMADKLPPETHDHIMHAALMREGTLMLMASDSMGQQITPGNSVSLSLNCTSEDEINTFFEKLSAGGTVTHPLQKEFWGALFGHFTDKFGMNWMLNYELNS